MQTEPYEVLGKPLVGYMVNAPISAENSQKIEAIMNKLQAALPGLVWTPPPEALHITLFDWLAPLVEYHKDKDTLFAETKDQYQAVTAAAIRKHGPIKIHFSEIHVYPAAITIEGKDDGTFQAIRDEFLQKITLLPNTKHPPDIVHTSIARYLKRADLDQVKKVAAQLSDDFVEEVQAFRLIREAKPVLQEYEVLDTYPLASA